MTIYNEEERAKQIKKMRTLSNEFYWAAMHNGVHGFIEFCGFMNKFIDVCERTSEAGIDFNESNTHTGGELVVQAHDLAYLAEKFDCIFGPTLAKEENRKVFLEALGWGPNVPGREPPTRQQRALEQLCKMMGRVYDALDPHGHQASDCVCKPRSDYRNDGHALEAMEEAVSALVAAIEHRKDETLRGERVASNFSEEHLQSRIDDEKTIKEIRARLAEWFTKHAEATRIRNSHLERKPLVAVACKDTEGRVWSLPKPFRHHDVLQLMHSHGAKNDEDRKYSQGFLDEDGRYLHRKAAMVSAEVNNQILRGGKLISPGTFTSEDVW